MSVPNPPSMTNAPSPAPTRADPASFRTRGDAYHSWLVPWVNTQLPALIEWIRLRANEVFVWASSASSDRLLCQSAAAAIAAESPVANAAAAAASAVAAAAYASQAQAVSPDSPIRLNTRAVTANFTVPAGYNAASAGPISVADGITVTVSDFSTWSIQ